MGTRVTILSELFFDDPEQEIIVRDNLPIQRLLEEIRQEYALPSAVYRLYVQGAKEALNSDKTLEQAGVRTGAVLIFSTGQQAGAARSGAAAVLRAANGQEFQIRRDPALIGRPKPASQLQPYMLDADLSALDTNNQVSRPHAQITQGDGAYFLESLRDDNPAYCNDKAVAKGQRHPLRDGDRLRFGSVVLEFTLRGV